MAYETIIRLPQVQSETGLSRSTIYQHIKDGLFPPPFALGKRARGWSAVEVSELNRARIRGASEPDIRSLVAGMLAQRGGKFSEGNNHA